MRSSAKSVAGAVAVGAVLIDETGQMQTLVSVANPPEVVLAPSSGETSPIEGRRGVPAWAVVALVMGALVAGFLLGFAVAKSL